VLKKAGIIVAAAATGVLALTSVAFADTTSSGNVGNDCAFGNQGGSPSAMGDSGSSLLGAVGAVAALATDATTQANTANCTNVNVTDLLDDASGNTTSTTDRTKIEDSFNQQAQHHHR
jgi:hypothetical protein